MYGNVSYDRFKSTIQYSEYSGGDKNIVVEKWVPSFYVPLTKKGEFSGYTSEKGEKLEKVTLDSWGKRKSKLEYYKECGIKTYGSDMSPENSFILEHYPEKLSTNIPNIRTVFIDIETECEDGFPDAHKAEQRINLITMYDVVGKKFYTLGLPWSEDQFGTFQDNYDYDDVFYKEFRSEESLLKEFITVMNLLDPDIISGWNSTGFDIPFIYNRLEKVLGKSYLKKLAPFGKSYKREKEEKNSYGKLVTTYKYDIGGISDMDYMLIYKQFEWNEKDSYKLDSVCEEELGEKKKEHPNGCSFREFYKKYWKEFVDYNIQDVRLIDRLDEKKGYIRQAVTLSYTCKCIFKDNQGTITKQETAIYDYLFNNRQVIMDDDWNRNDRMKQQIDQYDGAYVKDPVAGMYKWVIDVDIKSLYPSIIMMNNISGDTKLMQIDEISHLWEIPDANEVSVTLANGKEQDINAGSLKKKIRDKGWHISMNNTVFENKENKMGVIPSVLESWFAERQDTKKKSGVEKHKYLDIFDDALEIDNDFLEKVI